MMKSEDERIKGDVSERLAGELSADAAQIQVDVKHGEVTLAGTVKPLKPAARPKPSPRALRAWCRS